jgi:hypothetical protein
MVEIYGSNAGRAKGRVLFLSFRREGKAAKDLPHNHGAIN